MHAVRQAPPVPHMKGAHESVAAEQEPVAHVPGSVRIAEPAGQTASEHVVVAG